MKVKVADQIEQLVARRFVGRKRPPGAVHDARGEDDDGRGVDMAGETRAEELVDVTSKGEGASRRDARPEVRGVAVPARLRLEARLIEALELDADLDRDPIAGRPFVPARADLHHGLTGDAQARSGRDRAEAVDRRAPFGRTAVEERQLRTVDADRDAVVDAEPPKGRKDVLHGPDAQRPPVSLHRRGPQRGSHREVAEARFDAPGAENDWATRDAKPDATTRAGMQPHAVDSDLERGLGQPFPGITR